MSLNVPSRSPLGTYYRSPLGVRNSGTAEKCRQYFEFQVQSAAGYELIMNFTSDWIMLYKPDGTQEELRNSTFPDNKIHILHVSGDAGWYGALAFGAQQPWNQFSFISLNEFDNRRHNFTNGWSGCLPKTITPVTALSLNKCLFYLATLDTFGTKIKTLDLRMLQGLRQLNVGGFEDEIFLEEIKFDNPNLEEMLLSSIKISSLDKTKFPNLYRLAITKNMDLPILDLAGLPRLHDLTITNSNEREVLCYECPSLYSIDIDEMENLEILDVHDSNLMYLWINEAYSLERINLSGLQKLYQVRLKDNASLARIACQRCPELYEFRIENCPNFVFLGLPNVPPAEGSVRTRMRYLDIINCEKFTSIDLSGAPDLDALTITGTSLATINLSSFNTHYDEYYYNTICDLHNNQLTSVTLGNVPPIYLNLEDNNLDTEAVESIIVRVVSYYAERGIGGGTLLLKGNGRVHWAYVYSLYYLIRNLGWTTSFSWPPLGNP